MPNPKFYILFHNTLISIPLLFRRKKLRTNTLEYPPSLWFLATKSVGRLPAICEWEDLTLMEVTDGPLSAV